MANLSDVIMLNSCSNAPQRKRQYLVDGSYDDISEQLNRRSFSYTTSFAPVSFINLPEDIHREIAKRASFYDCAKLDITCRYFNDCSMFKFFHLKYQILRFKGKNPFFVESLRRNSEILLRRFGNSLFKFIEKHAISHEMKCDMVSVLIPVIYGNCFHPYETYRVGRFYNITECVAPKLVLLPNNNLVSVTSNGATKIWDISTHKLVSVLRKKDDDFLLVALTGNFLAIGLKIKGTVKIYDCNDRQFREVQFLTTNSSIASVTELPNNRFAICSSRHKIIRAYSFGKTEITFYREVPVENRLRTSLLMSNGNLATASQYGMIEIWDFSRPVGSECIQTLEGKLSDVTALFQLTNDRLVAFYDGEGFEIWSPTCESEGTVQYTCRQIKDNGFNVAYASLRDDRFALMKVDGVMNIYDFDATEAVESTSFGREYMEISDATPTNVLIQLPDGRLLSGWSNGSVAIWDLYRLKAPPHFYNLESGHYPFSAVTLLSDGRLASSYRGIVRIWDLYGTSKG